MNEFLNRYADLTALVLALTLPLAMTIQFKRKARKKLRAVPTYFLLFGPAGIMSFIFFHLFENSYRAVEKTIAGSFDYNFRFYSLILLGFVIAYLGVLFYKACRSKCLGEGKNRPCLLNMVAVLLVSVPLVPITPIAIVPSICCGVSLLALPFVRREVRLASMIVTEDAIVVTA